MIMFKILLKHTGGNILTVTSLCFYQFSLGTNYRGTYRNADSLIQMEEKRKNTNVRNMITLCIG